MDKGERGVKYGSHSDRAHHISYLVLDVEQQQVLEGLGGERFLSEKELKLGYCSCRLLVEMKQRLIVQSHWIEFLLEPCWHTTQHCTSCFTLQVHHIYMYIHLQPGTVTRVTTPSSRHILYYSFIQDQRRPTTDSQYLLLPCSDESVMGRKGTPFPHLQFMAQSMPPTSECFIDRKMLTTTDSRTGAQT